MQIANQPDLPANLLISWLNLFTVEAAAAAHTLEELRDYNLQNNLTPLQRKNLLMLLLMGLSQRHQQAQRQQQVSRPFFITAAYITIIGAIHYCLPSDPLASYAYFSAWSAAVLTLHLMNFAIQRYELGMALSKKHLASSALNKALLLLSIFWLLQRIEQAHIYFHQHTQLRRALFNNRQDIHQEELWTLHHLEFSQYLNVIWIFLLVISSIITLIFDIICFFDDSSPIPNMMFITLLFKNVMHYFQPHDEMSQTFSGCTIVAVILLTVKILQVLAFASDHIHQLLPLQKWIPIRQNENRRFAQSILDIANRPRIREFGLFTSNGRYDRENITLLSDQRCLQILVDLKAYTVERFAVA